ncbi:MAG: 4-hydroxy-tetrahydrodipicolinate reductase [Legionellaceae bacterium]
MTIKVVINGARGRMGQIAVQAITGDPNFTLVAEANRGDNLLHIIQKSKPDIVLDLTTASAVFENISQIIDANIHPIIGTSGLLPEQVKELQKRCADKQLGGIIAPNFSIGAVLMMRFAAMAAPYFSDVEIIEMHHTQKEDTPSGTAIKTAHLIDAARGKTNPPKSYREIIPGSRGALANNIPIHSLRIPGVVATQEVIFGGQGETFSIKDQAISREAYMKGICLACKKAPTLTELIYGLEHLL